jgi:hypothetical protein
MQMSGFLDTLLAAKRHPDIPAELDLYGDFVGSWNLEVKFYRSDVSTAAVRGEAHFAWILEGKAIQDVWLMPHRATHFGDRPPVKKMYGTTLRVYDSDKRHWNITWTNVAAGTVDRLIGTATDGKIVQIGHHADGRPIRWVFDEIADSEFHWTGDVLAQDGVTWIREAEFQATRTARVSQPSNCGDIGIEEI